MKRKRFPEEQIAFALRQAEAGSAVRLGGGGPRPGTHSGVSAWNEERAACHKR